MKLKNTYNDKTHFSGIYRGFVVWNDDPKVRGRIKVFVPGVYSDKYETQPANLPWARPFSPSFGGGSINPNNEDRHVLNDEVGWCSVPHMGDVKTGSQVFLFFENGDINYPVYFGVAQSDEGWFSEHPNQHCFRSDNIRVRIDENVYDPRSTCKFNSYNTYNSEVAKKNLERDCERNLWKFNKDEGNIEQLETRLDIEIEATKINAVNLNIHGNVNMHIDGDWFVEHFGNKYEYQKGDLYVKHDGHTYIEETGHYRKVLNGNHTYEHNGNSVENQEGDTLITRTGSYFSQIDGDVTHMYNSNYKIKVNGNMDEVTRNDKIVEVGNGVHANVGENVNTIIGGHLSVNVDTHIDLDVKNNFEIHSKSGNIMLKTDGEFELMDGDQVTCEGFKNLGTRGNIQLVSTFGNINIQCIKNENLANFGKRSTVIPWNPDFVRQVQENLAMFPEVSTTLNALKGMEFSTDINDFGDFIKLMKDAQELLIYDGLPVFLPAKMIIQNPNVVASKNEEDLSWIPTFRDEATDWRSVRDDVMWKLPGRMMGNINIETWAGDINIKAESELGCAGNVNIKAEEKLGTFNGYKIGCINLNSNGKERIYPDPRDLFLDSDFFMKNAGMLRLFKHGTNPEKKGPVLTECCNELLKQTGYSYDFDCTNYNKFYDTYGMNVVTKGFSQPLDKAMMRRLSELKQMDPPKLGCSKCIGDYLLGIPKIQEKFYTGINVVEMLGGYHMYGFQRLNPNDTENPRGTFNISTGDFDKISIGDGHAIASNFMRRDFGSSNIGGMSFNLSGDLCIEGGRNQYKRLNVKNKGKEITETYEHIETPYDYNPPCLMKDFLKIMEAMFKASQKEDYIKIVNNGITLEAQRGAKPFEAAGGFKYLEVMPAIKWHDGGYISEYTRKIGSDRLTHEIEDKRLTVDFGFDFERCRDLMVSMDPHKLEANFKENEMHTVTINRGADKEFHQGGNSRWMQIRHFDDPDCKFHVEISGSFKSHKYKFEDLRGSWVKGHDYHDEGYVWWDDNYFDSDLVPWFPDSEFDIESTETSQLWDEINVVRNHHSWSKYGNHIKDEGKHKEYNRPTNKCGGTHMVIKGYEPKVDTVPKLWANKKGAGVKVKKDLLVAANQFEPHHFSLYSANCGKNQNIETSEVWNAACHIYQKVAKTAGKNLFNEEWRTADVNKNAITYKAAVNTNTLTLHSDHVVLTPDVEQYGGVMGEFNNHTLHAGNLMKTELIGNQDYFNYEPPKDKPNWKYDTQYTNNFEISQNGFHRNSFKVLNGTDTQIPLEGKDPEFAKYLDNELVISNGGYGDDEVKKSVSYYYPPISAGTSGTPIFPLSANNYMYITNGINAGTKEQNAFRFENGTGVQETNNLVEFENGSMNTSGSNIFRIDNQGGTVTGDLRNSITLNNDNNNTNLILSDFYDKTEPAPKNPIISLYSLERINEHAAKDHILEAPTGIVKHDEYFFDSIERTVKTQTTMFDTINYDVKAVNVTESLENIVVKSTIAEFNATSLDVKTDLTTLNADSYGIKANTHSIDAGELIINANSINQIGTTTNILGQTISVLGSNVIINKITATGSFMGHLDGSMNGLAMLGGLIYLPSPIPGSPMVISAGAGTTASPQAPESPEEPEEPKQNELPNPISNIENDLTLESKSLTFIELAKSIINKFIKLELSLLDVMNGK